MEIEGVIEQLCDAEASTYSSQKGHGIASPEEKKAWQVEIHQSLKIEEGQTCIDIGAGTGVLTHLLASAVAPTGKVIAQDISNQSLAINKESLETDLAMEFLQGDAQDETLFLPRLAQSADIIAARQSVVLLKEPLSVFKLWRRLLKPDGRVLILDALWSRASWGGEWRELVDSLPLSCLQSLGTIPYLLNIAGFEVVECRYLDSVNSLLGEEGVTCPRFIVVAKLPVEE